MTWRADTPRPGYWAVRVGRNRPLVAARIWRVHTTRDPMTRERMQRSPFLAAQIGLDIVGLFELWSMLEYVEASPAQRRALMRPPESTSAPRNGRSPALLWAPMPLWQSERARRITAEQYETELLWLEWAAKNKPDHPDFTYRRRIKLGAMPVPKWAEPERVA